MVYLVRVRSLRIKTKIRPSHPFQLFMAVSLIPCLRHLGRYRGRYLLISEFWAESVNQHVSCQMVVFFKETESSQAKHIVVIDYFTRSCQSHPAEKSAGLVSWNSRLHLCTLLSSDSCIGFPEKFPQKSFIPICRDFLSL